LFGQENHFYFLCKFRKHRSFYSKQALGLYGLNLKVFLLWARHFLFDFFPSLSLLIRAFNSVKALSSFRICLLNKEAQTNKINEPMNYQYMGKTLAERLLLNEGNIRLKAKAI